MMTQILILVAIVFGCGFLLYINLPKAPNLAIRELKDPAVKLIYNGELEKGYFSSTKHKIRAKPDFMYQHKDGTISIVEFKSRKSGVKPSDVAQLIATAIAVKGQIGSPEQVKNGFVLTGSNTYESFDLDKTSDELVLDIIDDLEKTRSIVRGKHPIPTPSFQKCRECGFKASCNFAKAH